MLPLVPMPSSWVSCRGRSLLTLLPASSLMRGFLKPGNSWKGGNKTRLLSDVCDCPHSILTKKSQESQTLSLRRCPCVLMPGCTQNSSLSASQHPIWHGTSQSPPRAPRLIVPHFQSSCALMPNAMEDFLSLFFFFFFLRRRN